MLQEFALFGITWKSQHFTTRPQQAILYLYTDRRIQVEEIAQALGISHGSVSTILHDRLGMRKLTAIWVPKFLSSSLTSAFNVSSKQPWLINLK